MEVEANGARLLLDLGLPLDADAPNQSLLPDVPGLTAPDASLLGIILTHGHRDHWGLIPLASDQVPIFMGAATERIMRAAAPFVPGGFAPRASGFLEDKKPFSIGPFTITPYLVDHSAYDTYAILVEADGKRLFYSADLRAHGRKAGLFERLLRHPPANVDVMLMEGSSLGRLAANGCFSTEAELEDQFACTFLNTTGMLLVACSVQNIDRVVTIYRACKRTGRTMIIDLYAAEILRATENGNIPQSYWPNVAVYIPQHQRVLIKRTERFDLLKLHKRNRIYPGALTTRASEAAFLFRPVMISDLDRTGCLSGAAAIWSQWEGYLKQEKGIEVVNTLSRRSIPISHAHTSGHASLSDLKRLAEALSPRTLIPIHTFEPASFPKYFGQRVVQTNDGAWLEV